MFEMTKHTVGDPLLKRPPNYLTVIVITQVNCEGLYVGSHTSNIYI